jgi:hypothetical protein
MKTPTTETTPFEVVEINMKRITCCIVGTTPMIMNRLSKKTQEELLLPRQKMNSAEKAVNLKHDPVAEYRDSVYLNRDDTTPTAIHVPDGAFHKALAAAAVDMPGATKAAIGRLASIDNATVYLFGRPFLFMAPVRNSGMNRTPDIRTRAKFPRWACELQISFVSNLLRENAIVNLLGAAGMIVGIGDWRPQKGGSSGRFRICDKDDAEYVSVLKEGRTIQLDAMEHPVPIDDDTRELLAWFDKETEVREKAVPSSKRKVPAASVIAATGKTKRKNGHAESRA